MNFEFQIKPKQLIVGVNGSGKSVFVEVLRRLRDFGVVGYKVHEVFPAETRTRWQTVSKQSFELEVDGNGGKYIYTLWVDAADDTSQTRVLKEALDFDEKPLLLFQEDQVQLFDDNHLKKTTYPFESSRSALTILGPRKASQKLSWFKDWLNKLYCVRIDPAQMGAEAKEEDDYPEDNLENFASWYAHIIQEQTGSFLDLHKALRDVIEGFDSLALKKEGRTVRILRAAFSQSPDSNVGTSRRARFELDFDELSDGQRAIIALYTLLYCGLGPSTSLCLDEPENYLALAEIQPWLFALDERADELGAQTILISHHPELIDLLAPEQGVIFSRTGLGPVRVEPYRSDGGKLSPSERIARGWERG